MIAAPAPAAAPLAIARCLGRRPGPVWLASPGLEGGGDDEAAIARELIASDPVEIVRDAPLPALAAAWQRARAAWGSDAAAGVPVGVGFLSYDLGRRFARLRGQPPPPSGWPELEFRFYDAFWVHDARGGGATIQATDAAAADRLRARLRDSGPPPAPGGPRLTPLTPSEPDDRYLRAVARVRAYLQAGDSYQVNLARRLTGRLTSDGPIGLELFGRLRAEAPAPHALWFADHQARRALVGNSPERFLHLDGAGLLQTAPIKGTRPRNRHDAGADAALLAELRASAKDRAEHVMIVDLERNDLGRVSSTGSVAVVDPLRGLTLPSVHHLVTTVRGQLRPGLGFEEILRATFPGGSITGAPKLRAMEIIDELEARQRGPYTGATGWLGAAGDFDLAIAIRTAMIEDDLLTLWVGGGVVIDSLPQAELEETNVKARAFAALVQGG